MSKEDKLIDALIDKHYNEAYDLNFIKRAEEENIDVEELENKINTSTAKIDLLDDINFNFNIDTLNIIAQADEIKNKRVSIKENIYFILTSIVILFLVSTVSLILGIKFLIYFEIAVISIMPWALIPLAKYSLRGQRNE